MSKTTKSAFIRARVEPKTKRGAEAVLARLGISTSEAINLFLSQINLRKGIPFSIDIPNKITIDALKEVQKKKSLKTYPDAATMLDELWDDTRA